MGGYNTKLQLLALHSYIERHDGGIVLDACCARSFDFVAVNPQGELDFIYLDTDNFIPPEYQFLIEIEKWFRENPAFKLPYRYKVYTVALTAENKAIINSVVL